MLLDYIKKNPFFLAPMAGVTDAPLRSFMREMGCGIITTELISARAIQEQNLKTKKLMTFTKSQRPIGIQIFGEEEKTLAEAAQFIEQMGVDFVDLNLGCPVSKIVKKGAGSALLKDLKLLAEILNTIKSAISIPLSVKIRTGWDENNLNAKEVAQIAYNEGCSWITIHGRTRAQAYSGKSNWPYIKEVKKTATLPVIGNGDLDSSEHAIEALRFSGCEGVMIGRGALYNPWIFEEALELLQKDKTSSLPIPQKDPLILVEKLKVHLEDFYDERLFLLQIKKFSSWFSNGFSNSTHFRKILFQEKNKEKTLDLIREFFTTHPAPFKKPARHEPFLMQGHG